MDASAEPPVPSSSRGGILTAGGRIIWEHNTEKHFIPASTIKIATALSSLELLGPSYRFRTEFYLRDEATLCIKGYGDPFLTSEYIPVIARQLKQSGVRLISDIVLDESLFGRLPPADGSKNSENPYDVPNGALAVNFNALPLVKTKTGDIDSGEIQTPLIPLMTEIGTSLPPGRHRVNVAAFPQEHGSSNILRYAAELFIAGFQAEGIMVSNVYRSGLVQNSDRLIYTHLSRKTLADVIVSCLKFSNNFIANQLFLLGGVERFGPPADWDKGSRAIRDIMHEKLKLPVAQFHAVEGSGLSRRNRMTPGFMIELLQRFKPHARLLQHKDDIYLKSGTLTDVHNYVGFFKNSSELDPFVIFLNQSQNNRKMLLERLQAIHREAIETGPAMPDGAGGTP